MASEEVLKALESLHKDLERLEPAIRHVEAAQQVTEMAKSIPARHFEYLQEARTNDINHKNELKNELSNYALEIHEESRSLQKTTLDIQQSVKMEQEALAKVKDAIQDFHQRIEKINFPDRLDKVNATIAGIMAAIQSLHSRLDIIERNIGDKIKSLIDYQTETRTIIKSSLESTETNLQTKILNSQKKQKNYFIITITLVLVIIAMMLVTKFWR